MYQKDKINEIYRQIAHIGKQFGVEKIVLFGSRARGTNQEKSDIDLAVYGCEKFFDFQAEVEEKVWTLVRFDMVDMNRESISAELLDEINRDGVILYEKI